MDSSELGDRLVVGVDFGTTFSGAASKYTSSSESADEIAVIRSWPGANSSTSDKVPTEITYGPPANSSPTSSSPTSSAQTTSISSNTAWTFDALSSTLEDTSVPSGSSSRAGPLRWGYELRPDEECLRCFKLLLNNGQKLASGSAQKALEDQLTKANRDVETVVADYLRELWKHRINTLTRTYGELFVTNTKIEVVITVPAVWSETAKDATLRAARKAGMGDKLATIAEPEAAAVYALQSIQPNHLRKGSHFVVCDAGGGTADLISYEITQVSPLRIREAAKGTGDFCGAFMVNIRFMECVRSKLGEAKFDAICKKKPRSWRVAMKDFEDNVKRNFDPEIHSTLDILFPIEDGETPHVVDNYLAMTAAEVEDMFKPVVDKIIHLVDGQVNELRSKSKSVDGIVLVGGFGQSNHLFKRLEDRAREMVPAPMVLQPTHAWTAVVRGAVLRGIEGKELVLSRKARRHYGIRCCVPFDPLVHPESCKTWSYFEEEWFATDRMVWYIRMDQVCSSKDPLRLPFYMDASLSSIKMHRTDLIVCDDDDPPNQYNAGPNSRTRTLCTLTTNLHPVPERLWERKTNSKGHQHQRLHYDVGMQIESGGLRFDFRMDDVVYGNTTASFK